MPRLLTALAATLALVCLNVQVNVGRVQSEGVG